jgi:hypothetical protein
MTKFGEQFGAAAYRVAKKMGNTQSLGKCALAVGDAFSAVVGESVASQFRGNAYEWSKKVVSFGRRYWKLYKQSADTTKLPAGSLVIWDKQPAHPYGHIEVADGNGNLCSDFIRSDKLALYRSNPAGIVPLIFFPVEAEAPQADNKLPYDVRVAVSVLNIRKAPSVNSQVVATVKKGDVLTVWAIETKEDPQNFVRRWGKNAKGFFALECTENV